MKILLIGKNGQVGWELQRSLSTLGELISIDYTDTELCGDLNNLKGIEKTIFHVKPDVVVNAAAYTAVDKAEVEQSIAMRINAECVETIAKATSKIKAMLVHYSTDYVFDGKGSHYRDERADTAPLNIYGKSKLAGEIAIEQYNPRHLIFRTSWVYATRGNNFIKNMLRLASKSESLSVINDQYGAPTGADLIADCTAIAIRQAYKDDSLCGIYHLVASGETTWYEYAEYIFDSAALLEQKLLIRHVNGVPTSEYPTPALRPNNSRLSNKKFQERFNLVLPNWKVGVKRMLTEVFGK